MEESFISHLVELRNRLVRAVLAVALVFFSIVWWAQDIYALLAQPLLAALPSGGQMIATDVVGPVLVPIKLAAWTSLLIAMPYVLYQAWAFVAPGLYAHEKRFVMPLLVASCLLFLAGMAFAYWVFFPNMFLVMNSFTPQGVAWMTDISKYLGFVMGMFLAFGVAFEVPVVVVLLVTMQITSVARLSEWRRYIVVAIFIVAAVVTPPDVVSQLMLALPMLLLYEIGLLCGRLIERRRAA